MFRLFQFFSAIRSSIFIYIYICISKYMYFYIYIYIYWFSVLSVLSFCAIFLFFSVLFFSFSFSRYFSVLALLSTRLKV